MQILVFSLLFALKKLKKYFYKKEFAGLQQYIHRKLEMRGIEPRASRMQSERSTI